MIVTSCTHYFLYILLSHCTYHMYGTYIFNNNISHEFLSHTMYTVVEVWYSLEQYIGLKEDKLSSTTVDFIGSEGNLETKRLYWFSKPKMC